MSSSSSAAVELAAPWCFNIDARKQDQDTGTTSSIAFKHVRLFLKNRFGDPGDDVKALEESQKREGCSMATPTSEFVLRFGADDKNKHYRDVSFRDVKKVFGKMIKDGKLTVQLGKNELLLCKGDARECGRLLKLITTMKQAPSADRVQFLSSIGKCSCCHSKSVMKEKKEEERDMKAKERERVKEEEKKQKMMKQEEKKQEKMQEKKTALVEKLETLESVREEIKMKTEKYTEEREQLKASKKAVKALQEQIEEERRMYAKEKKDLATEKEAMETERMAMNVERSRLNAKIEENKELKMRVEREREVVEEKQREVEKLRAEKEELIGNLEREVDELKQSRKDVLRSTPGGESAKNKKHKSRVAGCGEETPTDEENNVKFPKPERTSTDSFYGGNNNENNEKTFKRKAPASAATPNKKLSPEKKSSQRKVILEDDESSSEDETPEKFENRNENVEEEETEEDGEAARVIAENEERVKKMRQAELERQRMEKEREEAAKVKRVRSRGPKGDAERQFLKKSKEEIKEEKLQDKEHQRRRQQLAAESKQKSMSYTKATAKKGEYEEHRKALESMKDAKEHSVRYGSIPWPPESNIFLFNVMDDANERKMKVNVALKFWHPDKFRQMFGDKMAEADKDKIWERVQALSTKCIQYKMAANARGSY